MQVFYTKTMLLHAIVLCLWKILCTLGCECRDRHDQTYFCESDIAVRVTVLRESKLFRMIGYGPASDLVFEVSVKDVFKNSFSKEYQVSAGQKVRLITPGTDADCGISVKTDEEYLFVGKLRKGDLFVTSCGWNVKFDQVTESQKDGLKGEYDCRCKVFNLSYGLQGFPSDFRSVCMMGFRQRYSDRCLHEHGFCKRDERTKICSWEIDDSVNKKCE